jgi:protein-S-isoprenylcysteine O-methyltransferase Ste14
MQHAQSRVPFVAETMFVVARAVVYATVFVGLLLVFVPAQLLSWAGISRPAAIGAPQIAALIIGGLGALLTAWCIATFAFIGKGTPAVFDPPRRLVVSGPYRYMRNPMYFGAALAIAGAALYYQSITLLAYASVFLLFFHFFVVLFEEPALRRAFGDEYETYSGQVNRWGGRTTRS